MILPHESENMLAVRNGARIVLNVTTRRRRRLKAPIKSMQILRQHQRLGRTIDHLRKRHLNPWILFASIGHPTREILVLVTVEEYTVRAVLSFVGAPTVGTCVAKSPARIADVRQVRCVR